MENLVQHKKKWWEGLFSNKWSFVLLLIAILLFRFVFGVCYRFWFDDELQVYLIGLKYYTTGIWPYYGPDVVYTQTQIPGALQGLLVGGPFYALPIPEAPFILLNIISFAALCFFAWYIKQRFTMPAWFIWTWVLTAPWVMNYSTHVINPSYVLPAAILFFIAFFELMPLFSLDKVNKWLCAFMMGFSLLWIFQLHMSYLLLAPYIAIAFWYQLRLGFKHVAIMVLFFLAGAFLSGALLIPTILKYGLFSQTNDTGSNIHFNPANAKEIFTVILRYLSFASFELTRFLGSNTSERLDLVKRHLWAAPFVVAVGIIGLLQVAAMILSFFVKYQRADWKAMKIFTLYSMLWVYISFLFSVKGPSSHTFYIMFPAAVVFSFYCWEHLFNKKIYRRLALLLVISGIFFHIALGIDNFENYSMYKNKEKISKAIMLKDYQILGKRRYE